MAPPVILAFGTANFGRGVGAERFETSLARLLQVCGMYQTILGLQEIDEADRPNEHRILRELAGDDYRFAAFSSAVPILIDKDLPVKQRKVTLASLGLARVTPQRKLTEVVVTVPGAPDWFPEVAFLNVHLPLNRPVTQSRRRKVRRALRRRAKHHVRRGRIVVWVADTNTRGTFPKIMPREHIILDAGIDEIHLSTPKHVGFKVKRTHTVALHIDRHDGHLAVVSFWLKDKPKARLALRRWMRKVRRRR